MFESFRGESPRTNLVEVKVSEAQVQHREMMCEGSVERKREPMEKNRIKRRECRTSWLLTAKSISTKGTERIFGGCAWKVFELIAGDLYACPGGAQSSVSLRLKRAQVILSSIEKSAESIVGSNTEGSNEGEGK